MFALKGIEEVRKTKAHLRWLLLFLGIVFLSIGYGSVKYIHVLAEKYGEKPSNLYIAFCISTNVFGAYYLLCVLSLLTWRRQRSPSIIIVAVLSSNIIQWCSACIYFYLSTVPAHVQLSVSVLPYAILMAIPGIIMTICILFVLLLRRSQA